MVLSKNVTGHFNHGANFAHKVSRLPKAFDNGSTANVKV